MNKHIPQLDWNAYFQKFSEAHGGNPLQYKGRLLFPDGWRYGMNHRGPERAPEGIDEERELMIVYWKLRLASVTKERRELRVALIGLEQSIRVMSQPLQQRIWLEVQSKNEWGQDITNLAPRSCELDLSGLRNRIKELGEDASQCSRILRGKEESLNAKEFARAL